VLSGMLLVIFWKIIMTKTYVILEIARTYNSLEEAEKLINIAADEGVDAIKIQTIVAKDLMVLNDNTRSYFSMLESLHRTEEEHLLLKEMCDKRGIDFLSTPESLDSVDMLDKVGVKAFKVSSLNLVYDRLLRKILSKRKPVYLSTGMSTIEEIRHAYSIFKDLGAKLCLMHCSSTYPTDIFDANLANISFLSREFPSASIGYSDHTIGVVAPALAVALGASVIEKHFTLDRSQEGADHLVGIDPSNIRDMMAGIRDAEIMRGESTRVLPKKEAGMRQFKRRKLVASRDIHIGSVLRDDDLVCLQTKSDEGIDSKYLSRVVGMNLECKKIINKNSIIEWEMFDL